MTESSRDARLDIIGGYPPPRGGVSTHVLRLTSLLEQHGVSYHVFNTISASSGDDRVSSVGPRRMTFLLKYIFLSRASATYILSARRSLWCFGAALSVLRRRRVILRLQNERVREHLPPLQRRLLTLVLRRYHRIVAVSDELHSALLRLGVAPARIFHMPGFLPPTAEEWSDQDLDALTFIRNHHPCLISSAKVAFRGGVDLYGLDIMVQALAKLSESYPAVGLLVAFWSFDPDTDAAYLEQLLAGHPEQRQQVYLRTTAGSFVPLLRHADLLIRATVTDGDANTVREALSLGKPVVASDVVLRPEAARLFASRDLSSLVAAVEHELQDASLRPPVSQEEQRDHVIVYLDEITKWLRSDVVSDA